MPCDSFCKGCVYLVHVYLGRGCNYSEVTGHIRGCPSGTGCTRRQYGKKKRGPSPYNGVRKPYPDDSEALEAKPAIPKRPPETAEEYRARRSLEKKLNAEKTRARLQGRQHDAIQAFKDETGYTNLKIAELIGVSESTVQKWTSEYQPAKWDMLESIGIKKPEGVD